MRLATLLIIFAIIPQVFSYSQDEIILIWHDSRTKLEAFNYSPGFALGDTRNMSRVYTLAYYSTRANFTTGDVNGDGRDELIAVEKSHTGVDIDILAYSQGYKIGDTLNLKPFGRAHHYSKTGEYIACDINGDGKDEIIRVYPGRKGSILEAYEYVAGGGEGSVENLHKVVEMQYYTFSHWICGDVNGDNIDEIISLKHATNGVDLVVLGYSPGSIVGDTLNMSRISKIHYFDSEGSWSTGDLDGDNVDELILAKDGEFRVFQFAQGYTFGSALNLKPEFYMKYCCSYESLLVADLDEYLQIVQYSPPENVSVPPGERVFFSVMVESSAQPEIVWYVDGEIRGKTREFSFSTNNPGNYSITAVVTDGKVTKRVIWQVYVRELKEEKIEEEKPKPVAEEEKVQEDMPPLLELISPQPGEKISEVLTVRWKAKDPEGKSLEISISIDSRTFSIPNTGEFKLDATQLESGKHLLRVVASDGVNEVEKEIEIYTEREIKPPEKSEVKRSELPEEPETKGYSKILLLSVLIVTLVWIAYIIKISFFEKKSKKDQEEP